MSQQVITAILLGGMLCVLVASVYGIWKLKQPNMPVDDTDWWNEVRYSLRVTK